MRHIPHGNHRVPILFQVSYFVPAGDICCGEHAGDARKRPCFFRMDGEHARARVGCAHGAAIEHPFHGDIVAVYAGAEHLFPDIQPVHARADAPCALRRGHAPFAQALRRKPHGFYDLHITRAAADVVAQRVSDLRFRRIGIHSKKPLCRENHARDAEAALHSAGLAESIGVNLLFKCGESLHSENGLPFEPIRLLDTGARGLSVNEHSAAAACAFAAAVLYGGEVQHIAQIAEELLVFGNGDPVPVYGKGCHGTTSIRLDALKHVGVFTQYGANERFDFRIELALTGKVVIRRNTRKAHAHARTLCTEHKESVVFAVNEIGLIAEKRELVAVWPAVIGAEGGAVAAFVAEVIHMHDLAHGMPGNLHGNVCAVGADGRTGFTHGVAGKAALRIAARLSGEGKASLFHKRRAIAGPAG